VRLRVGWTVPVLVLALALAACATEDEEAAVEVTEAPTPEAADEPQNGHDDDGEGDEAEEDGDLAGVVWRAEASAVGPVTAGQGLVTFLAEDGDELALVALEAGDGEERWRLPVAFEGSLDSARTLPPARHLEEDGIVVIAVDEGRAVDLVALDAEDGSEEWRVEDLELIEDHLLGGEYLYTAWEDDIIVTHAVDAGTGEARWSSDDLRILGDADGVDDLLLGLDLRDLAFVGLDRDSADERWRREIYSEDILERGAINFSFYWRPEGILLSYWEGFFDEDDEVRFEGAIETVLVDPDAGEDAWREPDVVFFGRTEQSELLLLAEPSYGGPVDELRDIDGLDRLLVVDVDGDEQASLAPEMDLTETWADNLFSDDAAEGVWEDVDGDGVWLIDDDGQPFGIDAAGDGVLDAEGRVLWSLEAVDEYVATQRDLDILRPVAVDDAGDALDGDLVELALEAGLTAGVGVDTGEVTVLVAEAGEVVALEAGALADGGDEG